MNLRPAELPGRLKTSLAPIYLVHGEETLIALEAIEAIRAAARLNGYTERDVLTVEPGFSWSHLAMAANAGSLFADRKILELRIPNGKPGTEGSEALCRYAADPPPDTLLVISLPKLDKTQTSSKWFTALSEAGVTLAAQTIDRHGLPAWITERLHRQSQQLDAEALEFLVERVEGNLLAARQEIDKLALLHPPGKLDLAAVRSAIANVARYDVFQLGEAMLAGDPLRYARMLEGLKAEGEAPNLVLWAITEEARNLLKIGQGRARGVAMPQLLRECRIWGDKQKLIEPALSRLKASQLKAALAHAARIDRLVKGVGHGDVWDELLNLGLRLVKPGLVSN
ncbi:DNA polymerase III subunit delta [Parachitinimonas caeni]|uniref:DNA polymerase III subunit delta n=1 Tax=Parachitinimonas caeni TaxID=3031301 RepID=A0ABT7DQZ5_9NEIS|nr:DNA polymerase III subunit delta [Parachitinimonas caeni]MDK2122496.1 DNA polymerase III subunit delta [Parachitinimonas caeni]